MKYVVLAILALLLVAACTQQQKQQTQPVAEANLASSDTSSKDGCYLAKHPRVDVYDCFGCSNKVCRQPGSDWKQTDQSIPQAKGYFCVASPRGCVVA